jgi:arylsulfatase
MSIATIIFQNTFAQQKPNILVIMGDDIGWFNPSCYNRGMMGFRTPNIDRIASEGAMFMTWYAQQSCTAGRAAFVTGQSPIRTGLTKVGLPGADAGLRAEDPSVANFLKAYGYATGQFGKNHLGDKDEFLPTMHGFDEFFGNLYHLNAEEEPEDPDYPKNPEYKKLFGPRGVLHCWANPDGTQKIEDTGPLTIERMKTVDGEFTNAAIDFMDRQKKAGKPFFCYFNSTRMHIWTHLSKEYEGKTGFGLQGDGMAQHDDDIGKLLKKLDDMGVANNTIVVYTTDNGAELMTWPDGGSTPFRGEKATNWEGAYRVPACIRWPGVIKPGTIINDMCAHEDFIPTFCAAAGDPNVVANTLKGYKIGNRTYKVHLDGYNLLPFFKGEVKVSPRKEFIYWSDDGDVFGIRYDRWKMVFIENNNEGLNVWREGFNKLRMAKLFDMYQDPFERGDKSLMYDQWFVKHAYMMYGGTALVAQWLKSFKEFPPRAKPASFNLDEIMRSMTEPKN